jgi:hypothetical protein
VPDIEANTWWTSLKSSVQEVIALYHAHGTSEQYHSEIKSDIVEERAPLGKKVFRRRLRSVMQDLMYLAAKLVRHANRWKVVFWQNSPWGAVWRGLYERFCGSPCVRSG